MPSDAAPDIADQLRDALREVERLRRERDGLKAEIVGTDHYAADPRKWGLRSMVKGLVARAEAAEKERDDLADQIKLYREDNRSRDMQEIMRVNNEMLDRVSAAEARLARSREVIGEAIRQIEYLHDKFRETGSGNGVLARLRDALSDSEPAGRADQEVNQP
jgi:uncharacterized protein (UPF0335 family)